MKAYRTTNYRVRSRELQPPPPSHLTNPSEGGEEVFWWKVVKAVEYNTASVRGEYNKPVKSGGRRHTSVVVVCLFPLCKYLDENCHHVLI